MLIDFGLKCFHFGICLLSCVREESRRGGVCVIYVRFTNHGGFASGAFAKLIDFGLERFHFGAARTQLRQFLLHALQLTQFLCHLVKKDI